MKKYFALIAVLTMLGSVTAEAQNREGDSEIQVQGSLSISLDDDVNDFGAVSFTYGRFYTDRQEFGGTLTANVFGDFDVNGTGGPFWRYNFTGTDDRVPYVGAAVLTSFGDDFGTGDVLADLEAGIRFFLDRNTAFTVEASMYYDVDASELSDRLNVFFGFSHFWTR